MNFKQNIDRIAQQLSENKNELFYRITYGENYSLDLKVSEHLSKKNTGANAFEKAVKKTIAYEPDFVIIELYRLTENGNFKKKPESSEKIKTKQAETTSLSGFDALGAIGGINGLIQTKTELTVLASENERLKRELGEVMNRLSAIQLRNEDYKAKNEDLIEKVRDLKWDNKDAVRKYDNDIDSIKQKNAQLDRFLTLGGTILANVAGIGENEIKGLLGIEKEEDKELDYNEKIEEKGSFTPDIAEDKIEARKIAFDIQSSLNTTITANNEENAIFLMKKIVVIFNFLMQDLEHINDIFSLVQQEKNTPKTENND